MFHLPCQVKRIGGRKKKQNKTKQQPKKKPSPTVLNVFLLQRCLVVCALACDKGAWCCASPARAPLAQAGLGALTWPQEAQLETSWSPSKTQTRVHTTRASSCPPPPRSITHTHTHSKMGISSVRRLCFCSKPGFAKQQCLLSLVPTRTNANARHYRQKKTQIQPNKN